MGQRSPNSADRLHGRPVSIHTRHPNVARRQRPCALGLIARAVVGHCLERRCVVDWWPMNERTESLGIQGADALAAWFGH